MATRLLITGRASPRRAPGLLIPFPYHPYTLSATLAVRFGFVAPIPTFRREGKEEVALDSYKTYTLSACSPINTEASSYIFRSDCGLPVSQKNSNYSRQNGLMSAKAVISFKQRLAFGCLRAASQPIPNQAWESSATAALSDCKAINSSLYTPRVS